MKNTQNARLALLLLFLLTASVVLKIPDLPVLAHLPPRRVNIPYFAGDVTWGETAIFWFGENEQGVPSRNYTDVRAAYTNDALRIRVTVVDYYLWYHTSPTPSDDLTQYDSATIYLDTSLDGATTPQTDDYRFLISTRHWQDMDNYVRQAQGNDSDWNTAWTPATAWTGLSNMSWSCNPGPNSNACGIDFGWTAFFTIPWETLGLTGPPSEGTVWGLGVQLYDRDDQPPAGYVAPEYWPETFAESNPSTWGELHFGYADYQSPTSTPEGTTMIRAATPIDNTVEDSWMGGGGWCNSGHEGHTEDNHGDDEALYVGTETAPTHFPCFNKSYLRFSLDAIPANKVIISATLTLHHWGNAGQDSGLAEPSWVSLFTISDPWDEKTIHWNNAPLAQENIAATWIYPLTSFPGWPGIPYHWDATQAVAEAYTAGEPVSLAIYGSDDARDSSKYLTSSETGDWNAEGRPTLTVLWGDAAFELSAAPAIQLIDAGGVATYTVAIQHSATFTHAVNLQVGASPSPDLVVNLAPPTTFVPPGGQTTLMLSDTHEPSFSSAVWYTLPLTATGGGITRTTSIDLLINGSQVFLPTIIK